MCSRFLHIAVPKSMYAKNAELFGTISLFRLLALTEDWSYKDFAIATVSIGTQSA